jgi:hypothetical protein
MWIGAPGRSEEYERLAPVKVPRIAQRLRLASGASRYHAATVHLALGRLADVKAKALRELVSDLEVEAAACDLERDRLRIRLERAQRWAEVRR